MVDITNRFAGNPPVFAYTRADVTVTGAPPNSVVDVTINFTFSLSVNPPYTVVINAERGISVDGNGAAEEYMRFGFDYIWNVFLASDDGAQYRTNADDYRELFVIHGITSDDIVFGDIGVNINVFVGDVNGDGRITSADATMLARWIVACVNNCECDAGECPRDALIPRYRLANALIMKDRPVGYEHIPGLDDLTLLARWLVGHNVREQINGNGNS